MHMTAQTAQTNLTPDRVRWFAEYYKQHPSWGIFHLCLADGNWPMGATDEKWTARPWTDELREAAEWFNRLTPSQRRRLKYRAEELAYTVVRR